MGILSDIESVGKEPVVMFEFTTYRFFHKAPMLYRY